MGKINGSWSGMRKYLETEMITDSLKGRIRYNCTTYVGMDGFKVFEIFVDGKMIKRFSLETVNSYFIKNNYKKESNSEYWDEFWNLMDSIPIENRTEYTDGEFCEALKNYRNNDIQDSIRSKNPIEVMFAILDRRIGKKTLKDIESNSDNYPEWLNYFYELRLKS